ncbi:peptidoglycan-binding domain-containing protein [Paracoccaceae bacterium Fryx2]|nr:peptidoglycan-binding domain-containing protein [Paracoccaceae bacterium Fryx2]
MQNAANAGGFNTGTPDGQWGGGSKEAMRAFQTSVGIPATGAPDQATLQQLGFNSCGMRMINSQPHADGGPREQPPFRRRTDRATHSRCHQR